MGVRTGYKQGTPSWVDLATTDQEGAKQFYSSLFGWSWEENAMGDGNFYSMAQIDGLYVAAVATQPTEERARGIPARWQTYITVDDVDAAVGRVTDAGGMVFAAPFDVFDAGRMAVVADPTGGVVCLWQAKNHIGAQLVNEPGTFTWSELITDDVRRAGEFFSSVLGVEIVSQTDPFPYTLMMVDEAPVGGLMAKSPEMGSMPNVWAVTFAVNDADSTAAKGESLGGKVMMPPLDMPIGRYAALADPQGAMFSVIKLANAMP
ncbi:MAG: VOC family protein [Chloroflexi bacterium]|nr:VOC family protein [Chloroflexota bacterium]